MEHPHYIIEMNNIYREFDAADKATRNTKEEPPSSDTSVTPDSSLDVVIEDSDEENKDNRRSIARKTEEGGRTDTQANDNEQT